MYRILAGPSNVSLRQLINRKTINPSTLGDIYISQFGGRLTFHKSSYPLQCYNEEYRQVFNAYLSTILGDIRNIRDGHGKVNYLARKGARIDFARLSVLVTVFVLVAWALWDLDSPIINGTLNMVIMSVAIITKGKKWKLTNDAIQFGNDSIELKHITGVKLSIPPKKLHFEMEIDTTPDKFLLCDSKLNRLLPIISIINAHNSNGPIMNPEIGVPAVAENI